MGELGDGAGLPLEALDEVVVGRVLLVQDLQGDVSLEQRVVRPVDARHAARPDELLELVPLRDGFTDHDRKATPAGVRVSGYYAVPVRVPPLEKRSAEEVWRFGNIIKDILS